MTGKFFILFVFIYSVSWSDGICSSKDSSMEEWDGRSPTLQSPLKPTTIQLSEEKENEIPDLSTLQPLTLTPKQKIGCCLCAACPFICAVACFNALTSLINQATCGTFFRCFPCLECGNG